ncbi:MAG: InlB B-repeat-containing protein, partial [Oscillospiraceae bacterium]|nr:InlB B-repeat-containing protein [Oscillospiraceae bacterium]
VSLILSLLPLSAAAVSATDFEDITTEHWAYEYVEDVTSHGWFLGTSASTFSPDSLMTRGMFVTALVRYGNATLDNNAETAFTDVPAGQYYTGAVAWGVSRGLISGQLDSVFGTHDPITREDMVLIVIRMVDYLEINLPYDVEWKDFTDTALISDYAESALSRSIRSGIILGYEDGSVRPQGASTRAEVAAVLSRIRDMIGEINDADTPTTAYYTVTFDPQNGKDVTEVSVVSGAVVAKPSNPIRSGYSFRGWYTAESGGKKYDFTEKVTENLTLYGQWSKTSSGGSSGGSSGSGGDNSGGGTSTEETATIIYHANGAAGEDYTDTVTVNTAYTIKSLEEAGFTAPAGYALSKWCTTADMSSGIFYEVGANITFTQSETIELYASWDYVGVYYTVTYDANSGQGGTAAAGIIPGSGHTVYSDTEAGVSLVDWAFISWNTSADGSGTSYQPGEMLTVTGDITLYAQWDYAMVHYYSVTYLGFNGVGGGTEDYPSGTTYTIKDPIEMGIMVDPFTFQYWQDLNTGMMYYVGEQVVLAANMMLSPIAW